MNAEKPLAIVARGLKKIYCRGSEEILALDDVSLSVEEGRFVSFIGPDRREGNFQ